jgi:ribokinase
MSSFSMKTVSEIVILVSGRRINLRKILVAGSINMDIVAKTPRIPAIGETILGESWRTIPGGKGANQAVAAAKSGGQVSLIGRVGQDEFGETLRHNLEIAGVNTAMVRKTAEAPSGVALITVDENGNNNIVVIPGANGLVSVADLGEFESAFKEAAILMLQLEIPWETVAHAISLARANGVKIILDPAPAPLKPPAPNWLNGIDILTPNQVEAELITGIQVNDSLSAQKAAQIIREQGVAIPLIKLGADGVLVYHENNFHHIPGYKVKAVDTTAAGDSFAGGLATALAEGKPLLDAVRFANATGALSTTKLGAQSSIPCRAEIEELLSNVECRIYNGQ